MKQNQYTKVISLRGTYSIGWWYGDDNVVQGFVEDGGGETFIFKTREEAEAYRQTLGYKEFTTENVRADYEAQLAKLED